MLAIVIADRQDLSPPAGGLLQGPGEGSRRYQGPHPKVWQTTGAARHLEGVELQAPWRGPSPTLQLPHQPQIGRCYRGLSGHGHPQPIEQAQGAPHLEAQQQAPLGGPSFQARQVGHGTTGARPKGMGIKGSARRTAPTGKGP